MARRPDKRRSNGGEPTRLIEGDNPSCRFCGVPMEKYTRVKHFAHGNEPPISMDEARQRMNYQITKMWRMEGDDEKVYAANYWDGLSYGFDGEGQFCSKSCGYNFGRVVARDLPEVVVHIKAEE